MDFRKYNIQLGYGNTGILGKKLPHLVEGVIFTFRSTVTWKTLDVCLCS